MTKPKSPVIPNEPISTSPGETVNATTKPRKKVNLGSVALVAAGPGDPELLTLRSAALLRDAEVVIVDADAIEIANAHVNPGAEITIALDSEGVALDQAERAKLIINAAREGKRTVRLIAGDPVVDGTLLNEAAALRKAKVPFEVAPGVSEVTGIPAYAGFGLTGGRTRQIRVVDANDADLDWADLVNPRITLVVLNGADKVAEIAAMLLQAGADPQTHIAVTRRGTTVDQRTIAGTLAEIGNISKLMKLSGVGMVVVGDVVAQREKMDWFEVKSLFGWRVLIQPFRSNLRAPRSKLTGQFTAWFRVATSGLDSLRSTRFGPFAKSSTSTA